MKKSNMTIWLGDIIKNLNLSGVFFTTLFVMIWFCFCTMTSMYITNAIKVSGVNWWIVCITLFLSLSSNGFIKTDKW